MKPVLPVLFAAFLLLSACSLIAPTPPAEEAATEPASNPSPGESSPTTALPAQQDLARVDQQGAVVVEVTPLNLDQPGQALEFQVSMDTHSVDLGMDLVPLATLATDTGVQVEADAWDGPRGGHHVSGTLSFPSTLEGKALLEGASQLTLIIRSVDAETRVFTWNINQ